MLVKQSTFLMRLQANRLQCVDLRWRHGIGERCRTYGHGTGHPGIARCAALFAAVAWRQQAGTLGSNRSISSLSRIADVNRWMLPLSVALCACTADEARVTVQYQPTQALPVQIPSSTRSSIEADQQLK